MAWKLYILSLTSYVISDKSDDDKAILYNSHVILRLTYDMSHLFLNQHINCMRADTWPLSLTVMRERLGDNGRQAEMWN